MKAIALAFLIFGVAFLSVQAEAGLDLVIDQPLTLFAGQNLLLEFPLNFSGIVSLNYDLGDLGSFDGFNTFINGVVIFLSANSSGLIEQVFGPGPLLVSLESYPTGTLDIFHTGNFKLQIAKDSSGSMPESSTMTFLLVALLAIAVFWRRKLKTARTK